MRVIIFGHEYPPFIFGGIGTFAFELAKGLTRRGVKVYVITGYPVPFLKFKASKIQRFFDNGIEIFKFPYPSIPPRHAIFQVINYKEIVKLIGALDVDIIHGQGAGIYPLISSIKNNVPTLVTFHSSPLCEKTAGTQAIFRGGSLGDFTSSLLGYAVWHFSEKKSLEMADAAVAVSNSLKSYILEEMGQKYGQKIHCIHNGLDIPSLDKKYASIGPDIEESEKKILFAGRLFWRKGALNVIYFARLLQEKNPDFKIFVHGIGPLYSKMKELIVSLNLKNIELKGFTTKDELMRSMKSCKFVLIPSTFEACPMILLESMCLGKIPLLLNFPFSNELTQNGKYAIIGENVEDLINKLTSYKGNSLSAFSKSIKSFARNNYNMDQVTANYIEFYRKICR